MRTSRTEFLAGMAALAASASAGTVEFCPSAADNVCYTIGIPESTAQSGSGNMYFQITAPTTYQWVALGTGTQMATANIFLIYQDGAGNVTLSAREGAFHVMPQHDTTTQLTLLAGSGVNGDTMTANIMCANCETWPNGGPLSLQSQDAPWVSAWRKGKAIDSSSPSAVIVQHDDTAQFMLDMTMANIAADSNPFVEASSSGSNSTSSSSGSDSTSSSSGSGTTSSGVTVDSDGARNGILAAHGIVMAIVMAILYPLGSALMPILGRWYLHSAWQGITFLLMWAGFGLGVKMALSLDIIFQQSHTRLGTCVVCLFVVQPALGLFHHRHFVKYQKRSIISHIHIWYGRSLMVLGVVNGGLGLQLAGASHQLVITYSVVSAVVFTFYIATSAFGVFRGFRGEDGAGTTTPVSDKGRPASSDPVVSV